MKKILLTLAILGVLVTFFLLNKKEGVDYRIGISQIVDHPALNAARDGLKDELKENGINALYIETNANGDMSSLVLNTRKLINQKVDMIYAIATPSAQVAQNSTTDIPIVISAVTDAKAAGIVNSNITGVLDAVDIEKQVLLLKEVMPDVKKLGVIYSSGEQNSLIQVDILKAATAKHGIELVEKSISQINEVAIATEAILKEVDALYTPADNLIASTINVIADKAKEAKKVTLGAEKSHVDAGILMTLGIDYYELGKEAGKIALSILKGEKPENIEIKGMENLKFEYNKDTASLLGLEF
ncbi:ABC transporter substrate-binding protein [Streptobacillus felis]|uniref:ABC transporter substrate-binding protein n=1 Tax=Streptobacillus felis TaxID=1384509 RepID=UPI00082B700B|nr:ABC transporter substrate-binding protein [Streptobacillus felis]